MCFLGQGGSCKRNPYAENFELVESVQLLFLYEVRTQSSLRNDSEKLRRTHEKEMVNHRRRVVGSI